MDRPTTMNLSIQLDMTTALRLARFEVETGMRLDELLVRAVDEWEAEHPPESTSRSEDRIPVYFEYSPRGRQSKYRVDGLYDSYSTEVQITTAPKMIDYLSGERGAPSTTAIQVVQALNPDITPNRNGWRDWRVAATGQTIGELRRTHR